MKTYKQSITITVFNRMDLICQLIDVTRVTFAKDTMFAWDESGHIIGSYNLGNGHKWHIVDKEWNIECNCWMETIFVDIHEHN